MVYFKENYNFTRFRGGGGGGPIYSGGGGGGGGGRGLGVQMLILETHRAFFPGGVRTLYPPSGSAHVTN